MAVSGGACKRAGALSHKAVERLRFGNIDGTRERILKLHGEGMKVPEIAKTVGKGLAMIYRLLGRQKS